MRIAGGMLALIAALGSSGCHPSNVVSDTPRDADVYLVGPDKLFEQSAERYICPDRSLDSPDEKRAVSRVSEMLRAEGRNPVSLFMKEFRPKDDSPSMHRVMVGGECGSPLPMVHEYSIYSVDLATGAVDIWVPN